MTEQIELGPVPCNEDCAQAGTENYPARARVECETYRAQIRRVLGSEPSGATLVIKSFPHDFGSYFEVCCRYQDNNETASNYAWSADGHPGLQNWDAEARRALHLPSLADDDRLAQAERLQAGLNA